MFGVPHGPNIRLDSSIPPPPPPPRGAGRAVGSRPPGAPSATLDIPTLHPPTEPGVGPSATQPTRPIAGRAPNPMSWGDESGPVRPPPLPPPQSPTAAPGAPTLFIRTPAAPAPAPATTAPGFGLPLETPAYPGPAPGPPRPPVVLEVTPRGLGIGTVAGYCEELIRRNSRLPTEIKKLFTTSRDRQDVVRIVVCQGESRRLDQNVVIGDLILQGLPPRPRGETSIEVTFTLDASGILQVHARDALTGAEQHAELDLRGGMQPQDVVASRDRLQTLRR
jgi:molecular chaperone DnaK